MTQYKLVRSRRKTVAIHISRDASVEIRAPLKMPAAQIDRFVASKEKWIHLHLEKAAVRSAARTGFALDYGGSITLFGIEHPILAGKGRGAGFDKAGVIVPGGLDADGIKRAVVKLYRTIARDTMAERTNRFAGLMGVAPSGIKITGAKTRWASCSGKNSISFSWRLVMADEDVIDYVVVHELAHIFEHNHSPRFWAIVESMLPDHKARQKKLKLLQNKLAAENWDI